MGHLARNCPNEAQPRSVEILTDGETSTAIAPQRDSSTSFRGGRGGRGRGGRGGRGRGGSSHAGTRYEPVVCENCGIINHYAKDCQARDITCYNCNKHGHIARDCPLAVTGDVSHGTTERAVKTCYECGNPGHIARYCLVAKRENDTSDEEEEVESDEEDDSSALLSESESDA
ncbi:uncharacterized protein EV154DRAFT_515085 [Mucor mucedo]|uniref:uncharacterized protein n=1 Tax=Mucor mucedo TaxID=29922 RepID=UPI00221F902C|nr:uncharacterized protein EV154DRAFT_515085 [Mucor mucedo]KAI7889284.1 hypothetical protein EV154DRAFT_515085 [Mucor mucedo]